MTRSQAERVVRGWQERLGLDRWRIEILWDEPADEDENAKVWRSGWYDNARLYFNKDWPAWPRERFEQTVIHELLHLCHRGIDETWNDLDGQLHRDAWTVATARWKQEIEGYVDRMAFHLLEIGGPV